MMALDNYHFTVGDCGPDSLSHELGIPSTEIRQALVAYIRLALASGDSSAIQYIKDEQGRYPTLSDFQRRMNRLARPATSDSLDAWFSNTHMAWAATLLQINITLHQCTEGYWNNVTLIGSREPDTPTIHIIFDGDREQGH